MYRCTVARFSRRELEEQNEEATENDNCRSTLLMKALGVLINWPKRTMVAANQRYMQGRERSMA